ncbi:Arm DNA-binding domain-containing protein [Sphingobacterium kitahiroshimense]
MYVRITIQGKRTEFSTKKFITPSKWDQNDENEGSHRRSPFNK